MGSAEEQPISNKLSALYSKNERDGILYCPFFTGIALWLKNLFLCFLLIPSIPLNNNPTKTTFYQ
jgi:hypothetical protein